MTRETFIKTIANYYHISDDPRDYDWNSGCTVYGDDGECRWMTFSNILEALEYEFDEEDEDYD